MNRKNNLTLQLATAAIVGAAYAVLTIVLAPISYGALQCRVSEVLCILPFFIPCTAWGLFAGCILANLLTANIFDIVFGSLATLCAALLTAEIGKKMRNHTGEVLACLMPVLFNAVVVGAVITAAYDGLDIFSHFNVFLLNAMWVGLGELIVLFVLGYPLIRLLPTQKFFVDFINKVK